MTEVILARNPLYMEESVIHVFINLHRPVLCCAACAAWVFRPVPLAVEMLNRDDFKKAHLNDQNGVPLPGRDLHDRLWSEAHSMLHNVGFLATEIA